MNNIDIQSLMATIATNHQSQMQAIADLRSDFSEFKGRIDERLEDVEDEQRSQKKKQMYHSVVVAAFGMAHHSLANLFGWKV